MSSLFPDIVNRCNFYFHTTSVSYVSRDIGFRMISREVEKELVLKLKLHGLTMSGNDGLGSTRVTRSEKFHI